ncbi:MAG: DEAD/DEAH box helicase [Planctomycetaceae bacterium]|nr:DEAD/DEAH box helicase [Planctomycetaceae bacterium]
MKTYGTLDLGNTNGSRPAFMLHPEPHVMVRLKRVFERIEKASYGVVGLTATEEIAFELRWFLSRYPLEATPAAQDLLDSLCARYEARRARVQEILREDRPTQSFSLAFPPREYQAMAAELVLRNGSLLLADDVGLGKTVVAIAVLSQAEARPALVCVYPHLQYQWQAEFARFAPKLRTHVLQTGRPYPIIGFPETYDETTFLHEGEPAVLFKGALQKVGPDVIITTYHKLRGWADVLAPALKGIVFDEAQELRRGSSDKYTAAAHLAKGCAVRLGLSATPIYNYGGELHNVLDVLSPGSLGNAWEFQREWCGGGGARIPEKAMVAEPKALGKYLREEGLMLRRTRKDVGRELPGCSISPYQVDADPGAFEEVKVEASALAEKVLEEGLSGTEKWKAAGQLDYKLRLATGKAKAAYVAAFVRILVEAGEPVVLYGWHHEVYERWTHLLKDLNPLFFTGRESAPQREKAKRAFVRGETKLLVLSLRAGAGLDGLQAVCRTVVFGELDWSPGVHEQCIGRVYRDGQAEPVMAYYLLAPAGSDPVVADVLGLKAGQIEGLKDPDGELVERLEVSPDHVKKLARAYLERVGRKGAA